MDAGEQCEHAGERCDQDRRGEQAVAPAALPRGAELPAELRQVCVPSALERRAEERVGIDQAIDARLGRVQRAVPARLRRGRKSAD